MDQKKSGEFIAELRKSKNMTQQELADKLYISREAISKWERGVGYPGIGLLLDLSDLFGVTVNEILYGERVNKENKDDVENVALNLYDKTKKKNKFLKKFFLIFTLVLIALYFVIYYFYNYNSIHMYITYSLSDNFANDQGMILSTRSKMYFKLGNLRNYTKNEVNTITLYYQDKKIKKEIVNINLMQDVAIDLDAYKNVLKNISINKFVNNLYFEIHAGDITEYQKITARLDYKNDFFKSTNLDTFVNEKTKMQTTNQILEDKFSLKNGEYVADFKYKDKKYNVYLEDDVLQFSINNVWYYYNNTTDSFSIFEEDKNFVCFVDSNEINAKQCKNHENILKEFKKQFLE